MMPNCHVKKFLKLCKTGQTVDISTLMEGGEMMNATDFPLWVSLLGNFGFPIAITIYLFLRFEKKFEKLENVILDLSKGKE